MDTKLSNIDDILDYINSEDKNTSNIKQNKLKTSNQIKEEDKTLTNPSTNDIVATFDSNKLENTNLNKNIDEDNNNATINNENENNIKKKKKRRVRKKKNNNEKEDSESENEEDIKKKQKEEFTKKNTEMFNAFFNFDHSIIKNTRYQDNESKFRILGNWKEVDVNSDNKYLKYYHQTNIPTIQIENQFKDDMYPIGEIQEYKDQTWRTNNEEKRSLERLQLFNINKLRKAAECHRQVRKYAQHIIKPGLKLIDICNQIENMNRYLINAQLTDCGIGFPTGCSINHCAAHFTPNPGDTKVLNENDVCKIDFGTQVDGYIIDCAFTVAFNPEYDELLMACQDACYTGLKEAGIDVRLGDIGAACQEVMESYEVVIKGKTFPIKSIKNLCGHSIEPYKIHAGKSVPNVKQNTNVKMEEGEIFAIECFGSTGKGYVLEEGECSHYMKNFQYPSSYKPKNEKARALLSHINKNYSTLAFCRKWLANDGFPQHTLPLKNLIDQGIIDPYPPLCDQEGCYTGQFEHTMYLGPTRKEILSKGDDY